MKYCLFLLRYWPIIAVLIGMYLLNSGWAAIFLYHAGIFTAVYLSKRPWKEIKTGFQPVPSIALWIAGVCAAPAVVILLPFLLGLSAEETRAGLLAGFEKTGLSGYHFWLFVGYLCLPHPSVEEMGWRGLLFVDSKKPHLRDFEFASYHLLVMHYFFPFAWPFFAACLISLAAMGWIWRLLKIKYGGLAVPTWFHAGGDLGVMLGVWWLIR